MKTTTPEIQDLKPQCPCNVELRQVFEWGKQTLIINFESTSIFGEWLDSADYETFCHQALERHIDTILFIHEAQVEGMHYIPWQRGIGSRLHNRPVAAHYQPF